MAPAVVSLFPLELREKTLQRIFHRDNKALLKTHKPSYGLSAQNLTSRFYHEAQVTSALCGYHTATTLLENTKFKINPIP
jgi:hypothetical protein